MTQKHFWEYEFFDPRSRWLFVTPSAFAESLGLYVLELGHFFQDGRCYTDRRPENSFSINLSAPKAESGAAIVRQFPDERYEFRAGEYENHVALVDNRVGCTIEQHGRHEGYFIQFGGFLAERYCRLLLCGKHCHTLRINWQPELIDAFEKLVLLYRQPSNETRDIHAVLLLTQLLARLVECAAGEPPYTENRYVKRALEIIGQRFSENLRLSDLAAELHVNPSYLSRLIASETGVPFTACLAHARLNRAKELLRTTALSMEEIAGRCGFCSASHFISSFHQAEKRTPLQYRAAHR